MELLSTKDIKLIQARNLEQLPLLEDGHRYDALSYHEMAESYPHRIRMYGIYIYIYANMTGVY